MILKVGIRENIFKFYLNKIDYSKTVCLYTFEK